MIGENHATSDKRRDVEQQFCYAQTGSREYFQECEFKAKDYIPEHDALKQWHLVREQQRQQQQLEEQRKEQQFQEDFDNFVDTSA